MRGRRMGGTVVAASTFIWAAFTPTDAVADSTITLDGTVSEGGLDHEFVEFTVPVGTAEIEIAHDDLSEADILDFGLYDAAGFRGWGGGNVEPIVVAELAASRSYSPGPIVPGTWKVVIGKAKLTMPTAQYHLVIQFRDVATLAAQPERSPYVEAPALSTEPGWYAGDFHVHSRESGDATPTLDDIALFAASQGLDFVELSDHNVATQLDFIVDAQSRHKAVLLLPGVEFTTYAGHANGIGATKWVDHKIGQPGVTIESAVSAFREQDAFFSINHPLLDIGDACIGCGWDHEIDDAGVDGIEIVTATTVDIFGEQALAYWDAFGSRGRHVVPLGGSDDHRAGDNSGAFSADIGTPTTMVYATELSHDGIIAGLRAGRTVVKMRGPTSPMVDLVSSVAATGDTALAERTTLRATITGGGGGKMVWVKNGLPGEDIAIDADPFEVELPVDAPTTGEDRYRVDVFVADLRSTVTSNLWVKFKAGVGGEGGEGPEGTTEIEGNGFRCAIGDAPSTGALAGLGVALAGYARRRGSRKIRNRERSEYR